jgi:hypothetical protein
MALILNGTTGLSTTDGTTPFADGTVGTAQLASDAVTTPKIAAGAVVTADIADAAVTIAKLSATGSPSSSNFLRGDGSWQTASSTPTTAQVLSATAGLTAGEVGSYGFMLWNSASTSGPGTTRAGSGIQWTGVDSNGGFYGGSSPSGTWRLLGYGANNFGSVWIRIS